MSKIIFVPRTRKDVETHYDQKIGTLDNLQAKWGNCHCCTLDDIGQFRLQNGTQIYVIPGHGAVASGVVFWGDKQNTLSAETVAQSTAERFPDSTGASIEIKIKIFSCHSSEGGYDSFASQFARAFRLIGSNYEVTIFGYRGAITSSRFVLNEGLVSISNDKKFFPSGYTGPNRSVAVGVEHRWSKINHFQYQGTAKEFRDTVASLRFYR